LHYDTEFVWPSLEQAYLGSEGFCYGLSSHFGILVDGTVVPCCLDKEGKIPLGDANTKSIESILQNEKAREILNGFRQRKLVNSLCQRCNYIDRFATKSPEVQFSS
jgi:radical SAM protein with 4Fe4S-binding SPASM domain